MPEQNISLIRRWFDEVWNQGRLETIRELMAPDAIGVAKAGQARRSTVLLSFEHLWSDCEPRSPTFL